MKKIKVFYGDKRLKDIYPGATKFEVFKYNLAQFLRKVFIVMVGTAFTTIIFIIMKDVYITKELEKLRGNQIVDVPVVVGSLQEKIYELQNEVLDTLTACESGGASESDGLVTFDPNPNNPKVQKASFGLYQFKQSTVIHYYKVLYGKDITGKEAIDIAMNEKTSRQLTSDIIFKTNNGLDNWYNCAVNKNLYQEVKLIKKING